MGSGASDSTPAAEVSPFDQNLAYVPYKGTTIYRKTLRYNKIKFIPREFAENEFQLDRIKTQLLQKLGKAQRKQLRASGHLNRQISSSEEESADAVSASQRFSARDYEVSNNNRGGENSRTNTVRNSFEGIKKNKIFIED
jgi:hypothetical protein